MPNEHRLEDRSAIAEQMYRYARATDWLETEQHREVFAHDCVFASPHSGDMQLVMQLRHSGVVQLDGDRASARWQITEFQVLADGSPRFVAGRYEDEHVRRPQGWQFARRTFTARYLGDIALSSGVRPDAAPLFALWP